jgi:hypothetical protein
MRFDSNKELDFYNNLVNYFNEKTFSNEGYKSK